MVMWYILEFIEIWQKKRSVYGNV